MGSLKFLAIDSFVFGVSIVIGRVMSLISVLILARHFTVGDYGLFDFYIVLIGSCATIFAMGQDSTVARFFFELSDQEKKELISQSLIFQLGACFFLSLCFWLLKDIVLPSVGSTNSFFFLGFSLMVLPFAIIFNFSQNLLKWTFQRTKFMVVALGFSMMQAATIFIFSIFFDFGLKDLFPLVLLPYVFFAFVGLFFIRSWLLVPSKLNYIISTVSYSAPYAAIAVLSACLPILERMVVQSALTPHDLGTYAIATRIVLLLSVFVAAFQLSWGPFSYSLYIGGSKDDARTAFNVIIKVYAQILCTVALVISFLSPWLIDLIAGADYLGASNLIFPLAMASIVHSVGLVLEFGIDIAKKSYLKVVAYVLNIVTFFLFSVLLVPNFGALGVGMGALAGALVRTILVTAFAQKVEVVGWKLFPVAAIIFITLLMGFFGNINQGELYLFDDFLYFSICVVSLQLVFFYLMFSRVERLKIISKYFRRFL